MSTQPKNEARGDLMAPALPAGYSTQPAWGFDLGPAGLLCEFHRVYGPTTKSPAGIGVHAIDEAQSYWAVILPPPAGRRGLTFTAARKLLSPRMNFGQFSSLAYMRDKLTELFLESVEASDPAPKG